VNDLLRHPWFRVLLIATTVAMVSMALRELGPVVGPVLGAVYEVLVPVAIGFVVAYVLTPVVDLISRRVGFTRAIATAALFLAVTLFLVAALVLAVPPVLRQGTALAQQAVGGEPFTDLDQDGAWQPGEPYEDHNRNRLRDGPLVANAVAWVEAKQTALQRLAGAPPSPEGHAMAAFYLQERGRLEAAGLAATQAHATVLPVLAVVRGLAATGRPDPGAVDRLRELLVDPAASASAGAAAIQALAAAERGGDRDAADILDLIPRQDSATGRSIAGAVSGVERSLRGWLDRLPERLAAAGGDAAGGVQRVIALAVDALLVPIYAFFLVLAMPAIRSTVREAIPHRHRDQVLGITGEIEKAVAAFFRGRLIISAVCALTGVIGFLVTGLVGVGTPYGILFGIGIGLATIIPLAGLVLLVPALVLTWLQPGAGPLDLILVIGVYAVIQAVEAVLIPVVMGRDIELHPVTLIIALLLCGKLLGVLGLILAVPIAATVRILARVYLWPRLRAWTNQGLDAVQPPQPPA
jgi:predicted PurR-regulated permease PerM